MWIEAMRLRTLPVSVAGVITAAAQCQLSGELRVTPVVLCLLFAVLAQIASNFANEYYDFKAGLDRPGREGPRRGVTEGDITPQSMKKATFFTLGSACVIGLSLVFYGGLWLIAAGIAIALGALAYSAGPYPLSRHALGEVAVFFFFGIIPVNLTYYVSTLHWSLECLASSVIIGLYGANVLITNNYRDAVDDASVGKTTIAVKFGRNFAATLYLMNGIAAFLLMSLTWNDDESWTIVIRSLFLLIHLILWNRLIKLEGAKITKILAATSMLMLAYALSQKLIDLAIFVHFLWVRKFLTGGTQNE